MGTNFYWQPTPNAEEQYHVGKRSGAGNGLLSYGFEGMREGPDGPIDSWQRWKNVILSGGILVDEYGTEWAPRDFFAEVEATTVENRRRQYDWVQEHKDEPGYAWHTFDDWLDADGFSFTFLEFT